MLNVNFKGNPLVIFSTYMTALLQDTLNSNTMQRLQLKTDDNRGNKTGIK
jgi:hypothetical protein